MTLSQYSRGSASQFTNDAEELTDAELAAQVSELKNKVHLLRLENEIFEKTLMRLEPSLLNGIQHALEYATKLQSGAFLSGSSFVRSQYSRLGLESIASPSRMLTSASRISTRRQDSTRSGGGIFGAGPRINVLEKSELVTKEMEIIVENLEKARCKAAKDHALLKAQIEEIGVRVEDIGTAKEHFNKDVIVDGFDKLTQRIPAEIWVRYMMEWVKSTDGQIGKLRLRTSTLNTQFSKLKSQIAAKAELSENLRPVDFEKLEIQNMTCRETIERKMSHLAELKKFTGDANLNLTIHKKLMNEQNLYMKKVLDTIKKRQKSIMQLDRERSVIALEAEKIENSFRAIRSFRLKYETPDVMDYVSIKAELDQLKNTIKMLEHRKRIQEIAFNSLSKKLMCMKV